jgi:hypothetical protein
MALPIRSPAWPPASGQTPVQPGRNDARLAAQKAFFEAALAGKVTAQTQTEAGVATTVQPVRASAASDAPASDNIPRPGSIIDIWV